MEASQKNEVLCNGKSAQISFKDFRTGLMPDAFLRRGNNVEIPPEGAGACTGLLPEESFCIHLKKGTSAVCPYDSLYNSRTSVLRWLVKVAAFSSAGKLYMAYLGLLILLIVAFIALLTTKNIQTADAQG